MSEEVGGLRFPFYCATRRELQIGFCHSPAEFTRFNPSLCWDASFQTHPPTWVTSGRDSEWKNSGVNFLFSALDLSNQWFVFSFKRCCVFVRPSDTSPFHASHHSMPLKIRCSVTTHTVGGIRQHALTSGSLHSSSVPLCVFATAECSYWTTPHQNDIFPHMLFPEVLFSGSCSTECLLRHLCLSPLVSK